MSYRVKLDIFEGPFDLLVHLIETAKMDIYNIEITAITNQYIDYIASIGKFNVEIATEFILLAANLMDIKSKMLLPKINPDGTVEETEDPRSDLVERLLEYKRFKTAAKCFEELEKENLDIFSKPKEDISMYMENPQEFLQLDTIQFIRAFEAFLNKKEKIKDIRERYELVPRRAITTEERMAFIEKIFEAEPDRVVDFKETLEGKEDNYSKAVSFVSVMELVKERKLKAEQRRIFGNISLKSRRPHAEREKR